MSVQKSSFVFLFSSVEDLCILKEALRSWGPDFGDGGTWQILGLPAGRECSVTVASADEWGKVCAAVSAEWAGASGYCCFPWKKESSPICLLF